MMSSHFRAYVAAVLPFALLSLACVTSRPHERPADAAAAAPLASDLETFVAQARADLAKAAGRVASLEARSERQTELRRAAVRPALTALPVPVVGVRPRDLGRNFGAPRDGGKRAHTGIDIFAPRGREIIAVADGVISYIGVQPRGGRCLWLSSESGHSFYYAHLDRWEPGLYQGMAVSRGRILGYVGTTGNAVGTPPHLHFAVLENDLPIDPYPLFQRASAAAGSVAAGGSVAGAQ